MPQTDFVKELPNGLVLLGHRMDHVASASMTSRLPIGSSHDPVGNEGAAAVGAEWWVRGAGDRDTRQLNEALDMLGCRHSESPGAEMMNFSAAQLARCLPDVMAIAADVVRRPRLDDENFAPSRDLAIQDLASLEDNPAHKVTIMAHERYMPFPLGRILYGSVESLEALTADRTREHLLGRCSPHGAMMAVAGRIDWQEFCDLAERHFGDWSADAPPPLETLPAKGGLEHVQKDSAQTHICLAHKSVPASDRRFEAARLAVTILSGGMSSRLFTEVREKRGLVYHVSTSHSRVKDYAGLFTYAATVPKKAQETLEVTVGELRRLGEGIEQEELDRAKTKLKSAVVMSGDSTSSRSMMLANNWYFLGRVKTMEEVTSDIDGVTVEDILEYLAEFPARDFAGVVIGPEPLDMAAIQ